MSRLVAVVVTTVVSLGGVTPVGATSCAVPASEAEAAAHSTATFDGTPLSWDPSTSMLTLAVSRVHKGVIPLDRMEILASEPEAEPGGLDMAWSYELGRSYRVHAHVVDLGLATGGCSRNLTTRQAAAEELDSPRRAGSALLRFGLFAGVLGVGEALAVTSVPA